MKKGKNSTHNKTKKMLSHTAHFVLALIRFTVPHTSSNNLKFDEGYVIVQKAANDNNTSARQLHVARSIPMMR
jgi:predicted fused transcriptional regulator/phosphomethylpyrimidine kinase